MTRQNAFVLFLTIAFLTSTFIYSVNLWFSMSGFYLVLSTIIILSAVIYLKKETFKVYKIDFLSVFALIFFVFSLASFTLNVEDINGHLSRAMWLNRISMFFVPLIALFYFTDKMKQPIFEKIYKYKYLILLLISFIIQITLIRIMKVPNIDVYQVLRFGPPRVISFENPYETGVTTSNLESEDFGYNHYAYGPTTIFLFLPFDLIFKEPRYLLILANFLTAFALYKISAKFWGDKKVGELLSLIYLFSPRLPYFLTFSWTDSLIVAQIALALLFFSNKRVIASGVFFSLALGIKIFYSLPILFFLKNKDYINKKFILAGLATSLTIHLPFAIDNWRAMYISIVSINTGGEVFAQIQRFSLTLATLLDRQFMYYPPQLTFPILVGGAVVFFWLTISSTLTTARTLATVSLVFIITVFLGPIANANYYFTGSQLILLAIAFSGNRSSKSDDNQVFQEKGFKL